MRILLLILGFALLTGCSASVTQADSAADQADSTQKRAPKVAAKLTTSTPRVSHLPSYMQAPGEMEMDWTPTERPKRKAAKPLKSSTKPYMVSKKRRGSLFVLPSN